MTDDFLEKNFGMTPQLAKRRPGFETDLTEPKN